MSRSGSAAIVGGGLAGLAAALRLAEQGVAVELFEARRRLGGRASSFRDPATGELIDFCQHVSMGCCTSLTDFCRRAEIDRLFRRYAVLHFVGPDGAQYDLRAAPHLPAPLHLLPALWGLKFFSPSQRLGLLRALGRLARLRSDDANCEETMAHWLAHQNQSPQVVQQFWALVLVSALGETLDRVTVAAARKVFVDGFMASRDGYQIFVPQVPLGDLYGQRMAARLRALGVEVHLGAPVERIIGDGDGLRGLILAGGTEREFNAVVLAVPWRQVETLLPGEMQAALPQLRSFSQFESSPITGIHLWFDRPIMRLPHAVLVGKLSDWIFAAGEGAVPQCGGQQGHYYQVVISASRQRVGQPREALVQQIVAELRATFPLSEQAKLLHAQVVTEKHAVFSPLPGSAAARPSQRTAVAGLVLAGDWTATGWPATMESAVRSGYLAAETVLGHLGQPAMLLPADPTPSLLARCFIHSSCFPRRRESRE